MALKDELSKLSGSAFDHVYIDAMVNGHREVLTEVRTEAKSGSDTDVKTWAGKASSVVQAHLTHAEKQQSELGKHATH